MKEQAIDREKVFANSYLTKGMYSEYVKDYSHITKHCVVCWREIHKTINNDKMVKFLL